MFLSRLRIWADLLDPSSLLSSKVEIQNARATVGSVQTISEKVVASLLPHSGVQSALFCQSYMAGFNHANRNSSSEKAKKMSLKQCLVIAGSVSYTTCAGALPFILIQRFAMRSTPVQFFFRSIVPVPLSGRSFIFFLTTYMNMHEAQTVLTVRGEELDNGVQVFDSNGNSVGVSRAAGAQAVWDTAWSRAALLGTSAAVPNLLVFLLGKTRLFHNSLLVAPLRHMSTALVFGMMIPLSFSIFPQLGTIKKEKLEKKLQAAAVDGKLFYHRGL
ncbi:Sideroflexin-4 [Merluccius polli]|uniref:Sideroflexin-4 n=1 Tax=Merluccius polli TaxID=89951 RepID=A0AA47N168_MERPO|nr:Sideroflexin-4 [Merluccius polli]